MALLNNKILFVHINKSGGGVFTKNFLKNGINKLTGYHRTLQDMLNQCESYYNLKKSDLYIFTIVRNPWDRMLSMYLFYRQNGYTDFFPKEIGFNISFKDWIKYIYSDKFNKHKMHSAVNMHKYCFSNQINWLLDDNGNIININKIIRFENLEKELYPFLKDTLGLHYIITGKVHPTIHNHYSEYYDEETKQLVENHYQKDIEMFGYKFETKINKN